MLFARASSGIDEVVANPDMRSGEQTSSRNRAPVIADRVVSKARRISYTIQDIGATPAKADYAVATSHPDER